MMNGKNSYNPLVSVIIPNYNHAPFLKERIDSVLNQTYKDFEVIVLDDCSSDNSREIIERYRGHEKISHIEYNSLNSGSTFKQWQKGLEFAKGEWIWIAESDDVADLSFLEISIVYFKEYEKAGILNVRSQIIDANGQHVKFQNKLISTNVNSTITHFEGKVFAQNHMLKGNSIINVSACLIRKMYLCNINFSTINLKLTNPIFWPNYLCN